MVILAICINTAPAYLSITLTAKRQGDQNYCRIPWESLTFSLNLKSIDQISIYFAASELKKSEFKINRPDIYLFRGKWAEEEFFKRGPVFIHVSF